MRKATFAKLSLTAAVGLGTLIGQASFAQAETPPANGGMKIIAQPTTTTTMKPLPAFPVGSLWPDRVHRGDARSTRTRTLRSRRQIALPEAGPRAGVQPAGPLRRDHLGPAAPGPTAAPSPTRSAPHIALCDEITSDPGCTITHGECPGEGERAATRAPKER